MKDKLKILLGFFRGLQSEVVDTYVNMEYESIRDWDYEFVTKKNQFKPPQSIINLTEEIIKDMVGNFHRYNNYDQTDYWSLNISIYPFQNRINFSSECEYLLSQPYKYDIDLTSSKEMSRPGDKKTLPQQILDGINIVFNSEVDDEDNKVQFEFDASYDEIYLTNFEVDGVSYDVRMGPWRKLLNHIMSYLVDRYWSDDTGLEGIIIIERNKKILIDCEFRSLEWQPTDMDINLKLEDFER